MRSSRIFMTGFLFVLALQGTLLACLWDYDTLKQERARFPKVLELITGKFLHHSTEFYEWRIKDRLKRLENDTSNPAFYDDLAVAYQKTGQTAKAIETALEKEKIHPGLYETYSNLGTFYILDGQFEAGLPWLDKALAINPNAHFGREKYQKWLVEYAISRRLDGKLVFPLSHSIEDDPRPEYPTDFRQYLARQQGTEELSPLQTKEAVHAVSGMMRFANHDNPLLLEALGSLLNGLITPEDDAKQLAARAYLQAADQMQDEEAKNAYRKLAESTLALQTRTVVGSGIELEVVEKELQEEQTEAYAWRNVLRQRESEWIRDGKDPEVEFDKLYQSEPIVNSKAPTTAPVTLDQIATKLLVYALVFTLALIVVLIVCVVNFSKNSNASPIAKTDQSK